MQFHFTGKVYFSFTPLLPFPLIWHLLYIAFLVNKTNMLLADPFSKMEDYAIKMHYHISICPFITKPHLLKEFQKRSVYTIINFLHINFEKLHPVNHSLH